jgi:hypothetical protein
MLRYLLAWKRRGPAVLVVCGDCSEELRFLIRTYVVGWRRQIQLPVTVYFKRDSTAPTDDEFMMPVSKGSLPLISA